MRLCFIGAEFEYGVQRAKTHNACNEDDTAQDQENDSPTASNDAREIQG